MPDDQTTIPDPIRAARTSDTGNRGETRALDAFADLDWPGTLTTSAQDLGTDILVAARDRRFHRGEYLGVQCKAGSSNLDEPIRENGQHVGWWVRVEVKHAAYWADNALPHVLVLYDYTTKLCHWAPLTQETIESTGVGRKVRVPAANVVCGEQHDELLAVAATIRPAVPLEGTVWTGATPKGPSDLLRFALVAPRLIAPHPNSGIDPTTPYEVVALLMQARRDQIWSPIKEPNCIPTRAETRDHPEWVWRFVGAVDDWVAGAKDPDFARLRHEAGPAHERSAVTAIIAHRLLSRGDPRAARDVLLSEIEKDGAAPVDHAWLHLHLAQTHQELAALEDARGAAALSVAIGATQRHDVTATAIRGIAAAILFDISPWGEYDIGTTVQFNDTAVAWWRSQTAFYGASALIQTVFDAAVGHNPSARDDDKANNQFFAASIQAGVLGSHGQWRHYSGLLARQQLINAANQPADDLTGTLDLLRRCGDEKALTRATRWIAGAGPADAVTEATRRIDFSQSRSSTILAELNMLKVAGDVADERVAAAAADWLIDALSDPTHLRRLTHRHGYDVHQWVGERLAGILQALPTTGASIAVNAVEAHRDQIQNLAADTWGEVIAAAPRPGWTDGLAARLAVATTDAELPLQVGADYVLQRYDSDRRQALAQRVIGGKLRLLSYIDDLTALTPASLDAIRDAYLTRVRDDLVATHADALSHQVGVSPLSGLVAILSAYDEQAAGWDLVGMALADPLVPRWFKRGAIMGVTRAELDKSTRGLLADAIAEAHKHGNPRLAFNGEPDLTGEVAYANVILRGDQQHAPGQIARLAAGDYRRRMWAAHLASETRDCGSLSILAADATPVVRGEAGRGLVLCILDGHDTRRSRAALTELLKDRGRTSALAVAGVIEEHPQSADLDDIRALLADHASATVRRMVADEA
ncbi:hypothetical protein DSM112329_02801 [Paraconexibacter sp. AEG42_29]|uniref:DUF4365 domain-containing protein n=1 Tax=Paraconexibacter sp. AEG42_29 TaxID=2997339 RepID=A0AAU7AWV4_9ACTN